MTRRTRGTVIGVLIYAAALALSNWGVVTLNLPLIFVPLMILSVFVYAMAVPVSSWSTVRFLALVFIMIMAFMWFSWYKLMPTPNDANGLATLLLPVVMFGLGNILIGIALGLFTNSRLVGFSIKAKHKAHRLRVVKAIEDNIRLSSIFEDESLRDDVRATAAEKLIIQTNERVQLLRIAEKQFLSANTRMLAAERLAATADDPAELLRMAKNRLFRPDMRLMTIEWIKDKDAAQEAYYDIAVSEPSHLSEIVEELTRENLEKIAEDSAVLPKYKGCVCEALGHLINEKCECEICGEFIHDWYQAPIFINKTEDTYYGSCRRCGRVRYKGVGKITCPNCGGYGQIGCECTPCDCGDGTIVGEYDYLTPPSSDQKMLDRYLTKSETAICPKCGKKAIWYRSGAWQRRFVDYLYGIDGYDRNTLIECAECGYQNEQHFGYDDDTANDRVDKEYEIVFDDKKCVFVET